MQNRTSIIFFHEGFSPYLPFALAQARKTNPYARLVLLGDSSNRVSGVEYEHQDCSQNSPRRQRFRRAYVHLNNSDLEDERRCIERWLILADFLQKEDHGAFWFLDSDAFPMTDLSCLQDVIGSRLAGIPHLFGTCFCPDSTWVVRLADWILQQYEDPRRLHIWSDKFEKFCLGSTGGAVVHDMALIQEFESENGLRLLDLREPLGPWIVDGGFLGGAYVEKQLRVPKIWRQPHNGQISVRLKRGEFGLAIVHMMGHDKSRVPGLVPWSWPMVKSFLRPPLGRNLRYLVKYCWNGLSYRRYLSCKEGF
jgi:hypothetical protein